MRDVADLMMGDGWRPGLADALPGTSLASPAQQHWQQQQQGAGGATEWGGSHLQQERDEGGQQARPRQLQPRMPPMPPSGLAPSAAHHRIFSKLNKWVVVFEGGSRAGFERAHIDSSDLSLSLPLISSLSPPTCCTS